MVAPQLYPDDVPYAHVFRLEPWLQELLNLAFVGALVLLAWGLYLKHSQPQPHVQQHSVPALMTTAPYVAVNMAALTPDVTPDFAAAFKITAPPVPDLPVHLTTAEPVTLNPQQLGPQKLSTGQFIRKVIRVLILDEVDSFVQKAQLLAEAHQHLTSE